MPISTIYSDRDRRFLGTVSVDGKSVELPTRVAFEGYRELLRRQLEDQPADFGRRWPVLVEAALAAKPSPARRTVSVTVAVNGTTVSIAEDATGIVVLTSERFTGKLQRNEVRAADAEELKKKDPVAHQLYDHRLAAGTREVSADPQEMLHEHQNRLRKEKKDRAQDGKLPGTEEEESTAGELVDRPTFGKLTGEVLRTFRGTREI